MNCPHCGGELAEREVLRLYGQAMAGRRKTRGTGNPRKLGRCRRCGFRGGARQVRDHECAAVKAPPWDAARAGEALGLRAEGCTYREIGLRYGLSVSGVRKMLVRYVRYLEDQRGGAG